MALLEHVTACQLVIASLEQRQSALSAVAGKDQMARNYLPVVEARLFALRALCDGLSEGHGDAQPSLACLAQSFLGASLAVIQLTQAVTAAMQTFQDAGNTSAVELLRQLNEGTFAPVLAHSTTVLNTMQAHRLSADEQYTQLAGICALREELWRELCARTAS